MTDDQLADARRLARLAAHSADADVVCCECVYGGHVVRFAISTMELQHLPSEELWRRYFEPAWQALSVPAPVVATTKEGPVVGVVDNTIG